MSVLGAHIGTIGWGAAIPFPMPLEQRDSLSQIALKSGSRAGAGTQGIWFTISRSTSCEVFPEIL